MSTNFKSDGEQLDQDLEDFRQRLTALERSVGSGGGSGGGTTTRWHDVTEYGAVGDWDPDDDEEATDDTDAIQAAVDAAKSEQETVYFPSDGYKISDSLIGGEKVPFLGEGRYQAVIYQDDPSEHAIDLKGGGNLTIEGIGITHDHDLQEQDAGQCLFSGGSVENVTVRDCAFVEPARQAVGFWSSGNENIRVEQCDFRNCTRAGVVLFGEGLSVFGNYLNGTGDDAIALNTDASKYAIIGGNIVVDGAGVGEATGGSIKFHGRNMIICWNVLIRSNQYAIRGQIVGAESGEGTAVSPRRDQIAHNQIHELTDINPETQTRAAIELREFETVAIENNSVYDIGDHIGILLRNDARDTTRAKLDGNYVDGAEKAVQVEDRHEFVDISDLTAYDVDRVLQVRDPVESLNFHGNSGHNIDESCVRFGGVDSGRYSVKFNEFTEANTNDIISGSVSGGEVINRLNTPAGESSSIRDNADYSVTRWSEL